MGANTLNNRSAGQTILDTFFNDINTALDGDFVGRGATGIPTSGQNLGTLALPWGTAYVTTLNLNGSSLDTSQIVSPANRIISGKKRTTSNQPAFITPNGAAASCLIAGATTNLLLSIGGATVTVNTDITKSSLTTAPASQNTCVVNDTLAASQASTRTWGEANGESKITITTVGTNITALVGKFASFKVVHSAVTEYFTAFVESATTLSHCRRGYFYDSSLLPVNPVLLANSDTITLMSSGFVFMTNDATTVDVSYTFPTWAASAPSSPATGDYWYDTVNQTWKRYDGASFVIINRMLIGMVLMDSTNCVAARSFDFYAPHVPSNSIEVEIGTTVTNILGRFQSEKLVVSGNTIDFGFGTLPIWNGTNNYVTSPDYFSAFAISSTYYLYVKDDGTTAITDIPPYWNAEKYGYYNRHNPWRCIGWATTDGSSNWSSVAQIGNVSGNEDESEIFLDGVSAWGSTNTQVARFANIRKNVGKSLVLSQSATLGDSVRVATRGLYFIKTECFQSAGIATHGITINDQNLTTVISSSTTYAQGIRSAQVPGSNSSSSNTSWCGWLVPGDVIRLHTSVGSNDVKTNLSIVRVR